MNKRLRIPFLTAAGALLFAGQAMAQVEFKQLTGFGVAVYDINIYGHGIHGNGYYDFETNASTQTEAGVSSTVAINNAEQVLGTLSDETGMASIPALRDNGIWTGFPPAALDTATYDYTLYGLSENGMYAGGQLSTADWSETWGFIYNIQTEELTILSSDLYEYGAVYGVNNQGYGVGWVDDLPEGTVRMPAYFTADGTITLISENYGECSEINDNNMVVGSLNGEAFIYDIATAELSTFAAPDGFFGLTFTDIAENGLAIGYADLPSFDRTPMVYHPDLDAAPMTLANLLSQFGVDATGLVGTAYRISTDGNYIAGWGNGPAFMAPGWAVHFDSLLFADTPCTLTCPDNITVDAALGESSVVVDYDISYMCDGEEPEGTMLFLTSGLPGGSDFPIGTTTIFHQLKDGEGNVMSSCSFTVTVNDAYCISDFEIISEPITYVEFAGIENSSSPDMEGAVANEYFLDITGEVAQGETYTIAVEGNTNGSFDNYFTLFIDWNQDGDFADEEESYPIGSLTGSTGTDGMQATAEITVPATALPGTTRMRVSKNYDVTPENPCGIYSYGQTEDYTLMISESTGIAGVQPLHISVYPNPVKDILTLQMTGDIETIKMFDAAGKQVTINTTVGTKTIDVSGLAAGIYLLQVQTSTSIGTVRITKK